MKEKAHISSKSPLYHSLCWTSRVKRLVGVLEVEWKHLAAEPCWGGKFGRRTEGFCSCLPGVLGSSCGPLLRAIWQTGGEKEKTSVLAVNTLPHQLRERGHLGPKRNVSSPPREGKNPWVQEGFSSTPYQRVTWAEALEDGGKFRDAAAWRPQAGSWAGVFNILDLQKMDMPLFWEELARMTDLGSRGVAGADGSLFPLRPPLLLNGGDLCWSFP
eukprot:986537-Pelagomonas_calceolata.AAC.2